MRIFDATDGKRNHVNRATNHRTCLKRELTTAGSRVISSSNSRSTRSRRDAGLISMNQQQQSSSQLEPPIFRASNLPGGSVEAGAGLRNWRLPRPD